MKNNDNSISISLSKEYYNKLLQPFGLNSEHSSRLSTTLSKRPPLDSTTPLTKEQHHQYRQLLVNFFGLALFDQIFNMQQEISANILLHQHSLTFNNSNIVFDTSKALSITNFICDLNLLQASIFLFSQANAAHCLSNATATPTGPATSTQGNQHQDLW